MLSGLIKTAKDGQKGFAAAAGQALDPRLKSLLLLRSGECAHAASELELTVENLEQAPEGTARRDGIRPKPTAGDHSAAALAELERSEDRARAAYTRVMKAQLPPEVRAVVQKQYHGVLRNSDEVRRLRNRYRAAA